MNPLINVDDHKLMYHPDRVSEWKKTGDCYPIYIEVGPTNRCNHKCIFCALDYLEHGGVDIDSKVLLTNLEDMALNGVKSVMFAGEGEPLLHKDISDFVKIAKNNGMDVSITSNGAVFSKKKAENIIPYLSWIRFSVDAGTKETYAKIHGTSERDFDRVIENIKYAIKIKRDNNYKVTIGIQTLLISQNAEEIEDLVKKAKDFGVDNVQIKPYSHHPDSKNNLTPDYTKIFDFKERLQNFSDENFKIFYRDKTINRICDGRDYNECFGLPFFALIDSRANVIPCNMFYNNDEFTYGNLYQNKFSEIWTSKKRKEVIEKINKNGIENCRIGCRLDVINRYLNRLTNPEPHDNFI